MRRTVSAIVMLAFGSLVAGTALGGAPVPDVVLDLMNYHAVNDIVELEMPLAGDANHVTFSRPAGVFQAHVPGAEVAVVPGAPRCFEGFFIGGAGSTHEVDVTPECWANYAGEIPWRCPFHPGMNGLLRLRDTDAEGGYLFALSGTGGLNKGPHAIAPDDTLSVVVSAGSAIVRFQNGVAAETGRVEIGEGVTEVVVPVGTALFPTTMFVLERPTAELVSVGTFQRV